MVDKWSGRGCRVGGLPFLLRQVGSSRIRTTTNRVRDAMTARTMKAMMPVLAFMMVRVVRHP